MIPPAKTLPWHNLESRRRSTKGDCDSVNLTWCWCDPSGISRSTSVQPRFWETLLSVQWFVGWEHPTRFSQFECHAYKSHMDASSIVTVLKLLPGLPVRHKLILAFKSLTTEHLWLHPHFPLCVCTYFFSHSSSNTYSTLWVNRIAPFPLNKPQASIPPCLCSIWNVPPCWRLTHASRPISGAVSTMQHALTSPLSSTSKPVALKYECPSTPPEGFWFGGEGGSLRRSPRVCIARWCWCCWSGDHTWRMTALDN